MAFNIFLLHIWQYFVILVILLLAKSGFWKSIDKWVICSVPKNHSYPLSELKIIHVLEDDTSNRVVAWNKLTAIHGIFHGEHHYFVVSFNSVDKIDMDSIISFEINVLNYTEIGNPNFSIPKFIKPTPSWIGIWPFT